MPYSINGCGTRLYGACDQAEDGSYIATEWVTFLFLPLIPIRSLRVLQKDNGIDLIVYTSQEYRSMRVPMCWPQVRRAYAVTGIVMVVVLLVNLAGNRGWFGGNETPPDARAELRSAMVLPAAVAEVPLSEKELGAACGSVVKLDTAPFAKLDLHNRLAAMVTGIAFTPEELEIGGSASELEQDAFKAYSMGYETWDDPKNGTRAELAKRMRDTLRAETLKLTNKERPIFYAYASKDNRLTLSAFDLGRHDARLSPCPY